MNGHPPFVVEDQHDDLEDVAGWVWAEDEEAIRGVVVAEVVDDDLVFDSVLDVVVGAAMFAC